MSFHHQFRNSFRYWTEISSNIFLFAYLMKYCWFFFKGRLGMGTSRCWKKPRGRIVTNAMMTGWPRPYGPFSREISKPYDLSSREGHYPILFFASQWKRLMEMIRYIRKFCSNWSDFPNEHWAAVNQSIKTIWWRSNEQRIVQFEWKLRL